MKRKEIMGRIQRIPLVVRLVSYDVLRKLMETLRTLRFLLGAPKWLPVSESGCVTAARIHLESWNLR